MKKIVFFVVACLFFQKLSAEEFNLKSFQKLLEDNDVTNVDQAIELLPATYKENFTLMHDSRGTQHSSPLRPRAILYGPEATFIMAFYHQEFGEKDGIEFIDYDRGAKNYSMGSVSFVDGKRQLSETNPRSCLVCHGREPHPIWGGYKTIIQGISWPGAYGEIEDKMGALNPELKDAFLEFKQLTVPSYKRYASLEWDVEGNDYYPYDDESSSKLGPSPNRTLGRLLNKVNVEVLAQKIAQSSDYQSISYLLQYFFLKCSSKNPVVLLEKYFQKKYPEQNYPTLYKEKASFFTAEQYLVKRLMVGPEISLTLWDLSRRPIIKPNFGDRFESFGYYDGEHYVDDLLKVALKMPSKTISNCNELLKLGKKQVSISN